MTRKKYYVYVNNQPVRVKRKLFFEIQKMDRKEKYLEEYDTLHGLVSYCALDTDQMLGEDTIPDLDAISVEETVINKVMIEKLKVCIKKLPKSDRNLIEALFIKGFSERKFAQKIGIPHQTLHTKKASILADLKDLMKK